MEGASPQPPPASPWRSPALRPLFAFEALLSFGLWAPVWATWLLSNGLGLAQVALLDGTFRVGTILFGVPIGMLADRIGPRRVLLGAALSYSAALAVMAGAPRFHLLVAGWLLWSASSAAYFSAVTPYLYACAGAGRSAGPPGGAAFRAAAATCSLIILASTASASLVGGWLYGARPWLPFAGDVVLGLLAAAVLLRATDGVRSGLAGEGGDGGGADPGRLVDLLRSRAAPGLREELSRWPVLRLLVLRAVGALLMWGHYVFYQPVLAALGLSVGQSAAVYAMVQLAGASGAHLASRHAHRSAGGIGEGRHPVATWLGVLFLLHLPLSLSVLGAPALLVVPSLTAAWCWFHYRDAGLMWRLNAQVGDGNRGAVAALESATAALLLLGSDVIAGVMADRLGAAYAPLAVAGIALVVTLAVTVAGAGWAGRAASARTSSLVEGVRVTP